MRRAGGNGGKSKRGPRLLRLWVKAPNTSSEIGTTRLHGAIPRRRAISRRGTLENARRRISRTWRMETLSAGIRTHLPRDKTKGGDLNGPAGRATPPPRAPSSRNGGRDHFGRLGE